MEGLVVLHHLLAALLAIDRACKGAVIRDRDVLETYAVIGKPEDAAREIVKRYGDLCSTISFRAIAQ